MAQESQGEDTQPNTAYEVRQDERLFPGYLLAMAWPGAVKDPEFTAIPHEALVFSHEHYTTPKDDEAFRTGVAFALESVRRHVARKQKEGSQVS